MKISFTEYGLILYLLVFSLLIYLEGVWHCSCGYGYVKTQLYSVWLDMNHIFYARGSHQELRLSLGFWKAISICFQVHLSIWKHSLSSSSTKRFVEEKTIGKKYQNVLQIWKSYLPLLTIYKIYHYHLIPNLFQPCYSPSFPSLVFILLTCFLLFLWEFSLPDSFNQR
jgi:hypothetical protein